MTRASRPANLIALIVLLLAGGWVFVNRAGENGSRVNTDISRTDQGAYIKYAIAMRETDFATVGRRNRMPVFPAILALFMDKGETPDGFFEKGKTINTWLALAGLGFVAAVFLLAFPRHFALNLLFLAAFEVFLFKAAYVQAEVIYYLLAFAIFLLCWHLFRKPRWALGLLAGGLFGVAHLTKASVLPGLMVVAVFQPLDACWQYVRSRKVALLLKRLLVVICIGGAFLAAVFPYLAKSKEIYGHYFYNVNSTFYFWCESWDDVKSRTKAAGDRDGWPDLPEEEIPSLKNYLRTHDAPQIAGRIFTGMSRVVKEMTRSYGYLWFCLAYLGFALWVIWCKRLTVGRLVLRRPFPVVALFAFFLGYFLLIAWYSQIIQGNRFILVLFLPFLFSISTFITAFSRKLMIPFKTPVLALTAFNVLISIWLAVDILMICLSRIGSTYGGS